MDANSGEAGILGSMADWPSELATSRQSKRVRNRVWRRLGIGADRATPVACGTVSVLRGAVGLGESGVTRGECCGRFARSGVSFWGRGIIGRAEVQAG